MACVGFLKLSQGGAHACYMCIMGGARESGVNIINDVISACNELKNTLLNYTKIPLVTL